MNSAIKTILAFSLGAAAGTLVSWKVLKTKYERITQEEIDSYKEYVKARNSKKEETSEAATEEGTDDSEDDDTGTLFSLIENYRSNDDRKEDDIKLKRACNIRVITPEEYDESDEYEKKSLTYYSDGIIADEFDKIIENPEDIVGEDIESHFGEYDEDSVFVRNDKLKYDYEILRDIQTYADAIGDSEG